MREINGGIYPTMITPYKRGEVDFDAVEKMVEWYIKEGCHGIFAVCQSSEMSFLSLKERVKIASAVSQIANGRIDVVASGHCAESLEEQAEEINAMAAAGVNAVIMVTNRLDLHNDGDVVFLENTEKLMGLIAKDAALGFYECPAPYKRYLTTRILQWCKNNKRIRFIKDTCCNPVLIKERLDLLKGSECMLFNANEQTLLHSLRAGGSGYTGIMGNFHPKLLVWLWDNFKINPEKAEVISDILSMTAFTENEVYPCTAKYYLNLVGVSMDIFSRKTNCKKLNEYQRFIINQLHHLNGEMEKYLNI